MMNTEINQFTVQEFKELVKKSVHEALNGQVINNTPEKLIGIKEASDFLKIAPQTIYGLTSRLEIPHLKKGKKLLFRLSELEKWMDEGQFGKRKETAL